MKSQSDNNESKLGNGRLFSDQENKYLNYFETSIKNYNKLLFSRTFDDMQTESLDVHTVTLGPFPKKILFNFQISSLHDTTVRLQFSFKEWKDQLFASTQDEEVR